MDVDAAGPRCQFSWDVMEAICNLHSKLLKNYIAYAAKVGLWSPEDNRVFAVQAYAVKVLQQEE